MENPVFQKVLKLLESGMPEKPTNGQVDFINKFSDFAVNSPEGIFLLKGYAGTGKTTMMSVVSSAFTNIVLLAPTGRAAKVLSNYTNRTAYTIHKYIYLPAQSSNGKMFLRIKENVHQKTLFIVDEASMIPDAALEDVDSAFPGVNLLSDLINFVYSGIGCRIMFVGDEAQLPPVHFEYSPALDPNHLQLKFRRKVTFLELTEVVRQKEQSGILTNATLLRKNLEVDGYHPKFIVDGANDVQSVKGIELNDLMYDVYKKYGQENVLVVTRSNKAANQYNRLIRFNQLWMEDELNGGDAIMVVKNNYTWLPKDHGAGFIANGDVLKINKIIHYQEKFGFKFALAELSMQEYTKEFDFEAWLLLDTLNSEAPALTKDQQKKLFDAVNDEYLEEEPNQRKRADLIRSDPFYNALQIKFAYAVTCHKSQGGQWSVVFVDQGYITDEMMGKDYLRWLYTAITRAQAHLYLLNFDDSFFEN